jgi:predicted RNA-binding protein with PUA-like domain
MKHWLMKSEPEAYSWQKLVKDGRGMWDGVRNHQAAANLRAMKKGDLAFFYHSSTGKEIVGICRIDKEFYTDPTDKTGTFVAVDVVPIKPLKQPVTLAQIKSDPSFDDFLLVRNSRLSVMPVPEEHWQAICRMGGVKA